MQELIKMEDVPIKLNRTWVECADRLAGMAVGLNRLDGTETVTLNQGKSG
jgi:hypothetical protein